LLLNPSSQIPNACVPSAHAVGVATIQGLSAEKLSVRFGGIKAISEVSISVFQRQILGLIGPNGAGKTTLVNCLTGYQQPSAGRILLGDVDTAGWSPEKFRKQGVARTFQSGRLFREMTVAENVEVTAVALGLSRKQASRGVSEVLEWAGLSDKKAALSGALPYTDERRLGIARAIMHNPCFVLLDEPAAGMSDAECEELSECIKDIPTRFNCGVLLIEHNMTVVMGVCNRIHVLDGGFTLAEDAPQCIRDNRAVMNSYLGSD
jgi:branched-chain amino acid transport system ATP-binding protein